MPSAEDERKDRLAATKRRSRNKTALERADYIRKERMAELIRLGEIGATDKQAAYVLNMSASMFADMLRADEEMSVKFKRAKELKILDLQRTAYNLSIPQAKAGKPALLIFTLKCQAGWRERTEVSGSITVRPHESFAHAINVAPLDLRRQIEKLPPRVVKAVRIGYAEEQLDGG